MFANSFDSESDDFEDSSDDSPCEDETADRPNISIADRGNSTQRPVESIEKIEWVLQWLSIMLTLYAILINFLTA